MTGVSIFRGAVAALGWGALALQYWLMLARGGDPALTTLNFFSYFTILTNLLVAVAMTFLALPATGGASGFFRRPAVRAALTLYIAVVGGVYFTILRHTWDPQGWQLVADRILHYAIPALVIADWLLLTPKGDLKWRDMPGWLVYPALYGAYALARGAIDGFYPYPFLDAAKLGYAPVLANLAWLIGLFAAGGFTLIALAKLLSPTARR